MLTLTFEVVTFLGSLASLVALAAIFHDPSTPFSAVDGGLIAVAALLAIVSVILRLREFWQSGVKSLNGADHIKDYLHQWISRGQRVVIFSRDLSWVDDEKMKQLLRIKAERHELELCLPQEIPISRELAGRGAEIYTYADLDYVPGSRFTIIDAGRHDAQVAIGRTLGNRHVVKEISAGDDPLFAVANDLVEVIKRFSRARRGKPRDVA